MVFALLFTLLNILSVKESGRFQVVLVLALLAILLIYVATGIRLFDAQHYSPFAPEGWPAIFTVTGMIFVYFLLIVEMGLIPLMLTGAFFAASLLWYFLYSRSRNRRESALLHVVGRITNRELRSQILLAQRVRKASV